MNTYSTRPKDIKRNWLILDAAGQPLGRLASQAAALLRGKHKPIFAPHLDTGDNVVVVNAEKVVLTATKPDKKILYHHSGYPGGLKAERYRDILAQKPDQAIRIAVRGMLPHNRLGRAMLRKLKIYRGSEHPHQAQQPEGYGQPAAKPAEG